MSEMDSQFNYKQLLERHGVVRIPMIQRDYAQGRPSVAQVRDDFLAAIEKNLKLPADSPSLPMNLDFIYGSVAKHKDNSQFAPLDGQQRLTTLFLLHWYLAWNDERFAQFVKMFRNGDHSRFSYSVRQSSNEFFDALVHYKPDVRPNAVQHLSRWITNQPWYFRSWRLDPTIQSVLAMLDAIHERFSNSTGLFDRLISDKHPAITFQLLDLDNFGLSDDLYIKMNARGKPLTPFETFKARYEQELASQFQGQTRSIGSQDFPIHEFVARRMDTTWLDLFWSGNRRSAFMVDESMFNVFRMMALITRDPDADGCLEDVTSLTRTQPSYTTFHDNGWLDESFTIALIPLLECWASDKRRLHTLLPNADYLDEGAIFSKLTQDSTGLEVPEILLFMAYALYIREHEASLDVTKLQQWMRVIHNLIINSNIDRADRLLTGMSLILSLMPHANAILEYLKSWVVPDEIAGNLKQQAKEEILKAGLILSHGDWKKLIERAELHGYFRGQIDFLLDFSGAVAKANSASVDQWDVATHAKLQSDFESTLHKAEAMFEAKGLVTSNDHLWERALITIGDYTLESGSRNRSLLVSAATEQASWKRLLRGFTTPERLARVKLRDLWSRLNDRHPYPKQLAAIVESKGDESQDWRAAIASTPQTFDYGRRRMMRFAEHNTYLLLKTQMNGAHVELYSFCFYHNELPKLVAKGSLSPMQIGTYEQMSGVDREPYFELTYRESRTSVRVEVDFLDNHWRVGALSSKLAKTPGLKACLEKLGGLKDVDDYLCIEVARDKLEETLVRLAKCLGD